MRSTRQKDGYPNCRLLFKSRFQPRFVFPVLGEADFKQPQQRFAPLSFNQLSEWVLGEARGFPPCFSVIDTDAAAWHRMLSHGSTTERYRRANA